MCDPSKFQGGGLYSGMEVTRGEASLVDSVVVCVDETLVDVVEASLGIPCESTAIAGCMGRTCAIHRTGIDDIIDIDDIDAWSVFCELSLLPGFEFAVFNLWGP